MAGQWVVVVALMGRPMVVAGGLCGVAEFACVQPLIFIFTSSAALGTFICSASRSDAAAVLSASPSTSVRDTKARPGVC
jgi:hypothetical protein